MIRAKYIVLGDGEVPKTGDESRKVRAGLIRLLLLGSDPKHQPHEKGVRIVGAWIPDALDLEGCRIPRDIALVSCRFDATPVLRSACIDGLFLNGGVVPGLSADRLEAKGGVFLRGVEATGEVRLLGAKLGGDLDCVGATFRAEKDAEGNPGNALFADGLEATGGVFLREASRRRARCGCSGRSWAGPSTATGATFRAEKDAEGNPGHALSPTGWRRTGGVFLRDGFEATGAVRLVGAKLGGDLDCTGATFRAEKDAEGNPGNALSADGAKVEGALFLRGDARVFGLASFAGAEVGSLNDDPACWPGRGDLILDRFRYGAITAGRWTPTRGSSGSGGRSRRGGVWISGRSPMSTAPRCCGRWGMAARRARS